MPPFDSPQFPSWLLRVLPVAFLAVTFLQSGLDKLFDWEGNLGWQTQYFSKTPLKNFVKPLLLVLTAMEVLAGALCAAGIVVLVVTGRPWLGNIGAMLSGVTFVALLFGQRMAKDYAGAAGIVPYFIVSLLGIFITRG